MRERYRHLRPLQIFWGSWLNRHDFVTNQLVFAFRDIGLRSSEYDVDDSVQVLEVILIMIILLPLTLRVLGFIRGIWILRTILECLLELLTLPGRMIAVRMERALLYNMLLKPLESL